VGTNRKIITGAALVVHDSAQLTPIDYHRCSALIHVLRRNCTPGPTWASASRLVWFAKIS